MSLFNFFHLDLAKTDRNMLQKLLTKKKTKTKNFSLQL